MKIEFDYYPPVPVTEGPRASGRALGESRPLTDVLLCAPAYLEPVPCCSVTRESLRNGFATSRSAAARQHTALREALCASGVTCHSLPPEPGLPDLAFTRDVAVATPWGLVALNPALGHRSVEVDHFVDWARRHAEGPVARIRGGRIEGGDVCIARPGLLIVGVSGTRTDEDGAEAFAARFRMEGWDVLICPFDEHFLHLDTIFCMLDEDRALACLDALDDGFLEAVARRGIELLPVAYKDSRRLGCNVLSVDGRRIVAGSATPRVTATLRRHGYEVAEVELDQFSACGGGVHCLTMPLARREIRALGESDGSDRMLAPAPWDGLDNRRTALAGRNAHCR